MNKPERAPDELGALIQKRSDERGCPLDSDPFFSAAASELRPENLLDQQQQSALAAIATWLDALEQDAPPPRESTGNSTD